MAFDKKAFEKKAFEKKAFEKKAFEKKALDKKTFDKKSALFRRKVLPFLLNPSQERRQLTRPFKKMTL